MWRIFFFSLVSYKRLSFAGPNSVFIEPNYGLASLNITNVTEGDRGWYNCRVLFLNRDPDTVSVSTINMQTCVFSTST